MASLILLAHGSPDPDWIRPVEAVRNRIVALDPSVAVAIAVLTDPDSLDGALQALQAQGHTRVVVVPYLLSDGGRHAKEDIPRVVQEAARRWPDLTVTALPRAIATTDPVLDAMAAATLAAAQDP